MHFIYTKHTKIRIEQRKLLRDEIEETIIGPDKTFASFWGRKIAQKEFQGKILEVVYKEENFNVIIIITAYWL